MPTELKNDLKKVVKNMILSFSISWILACATCYILKILNLFNITLIYLCPSLGATASAWVIEQRANRKATRKLRLSQAYLLEIIDESE